MTILYGFKLDDRGRMMDRLFDLHKMPPDWYDSPDKVPGVKPKEVEAPAKSIQAIEPDVVPLKRRGGRPKGSKNRV